MFRSRQPWFYHSAAVAPGRAVTDGILLNPYVEALTPSVTLSGDGSSEDILKDHHDWTYTNSGNSKGFRHQDVCNNQPCCHRFQSERNLNSDLAGQTRDGHLIAKAAALDCDQSMDDLTRSFAQ
ncbi:hypothetical protein MG293_000075 [Ovis ammon polii]|uniref:Uncharacterized protein n=1 Tax=Ovis ammon polii TaxID=230172 RepID=A0AAD4UPZ8_OVIAM|nr:hypothetical protein MG293_000075 [Ovis ammon polii]